MSVVQGGHCASICTSRLIEGGHATEASIAKQNPLEKYADHLPLYRPKPDLCPARGDIDRSTLAFWVGKAAHEFESPVNTNASWCTENLQQTLHALSADCNLNRLPVIERNTSPGPRS